MSKPCPYVRKHIQSTASRKLENAGPSVPSGVNQTPLIPGAKELDVIIDNFTASLKNAPGITHFETFADLAAAVPAIKEIADAEGQDTINVSGVYHGGVSYKSP